MVSLFSREISTTIRSGEIIAHLRAFSTNILFLKHDSSIFRQSSNPVCGFSMMEQVRLCAVWPTENWLGSSINHIQGWMNDLNMLLTCFRKRMPVSRSDSWNFGHRPRPQIHSDPFNPAFRTFPREKFLLSRPTFLSSRVAFSTSIRPNQNRFSIAVSYYRSILSVCAFIALH